MLKSKALRSRNTYARWGVAAVAFVAVGGCAHVNREELATELEQVRMEIRQGDQGVETRLATRIDAVEDQMERRLAALEGELQTLAGEFDIALERFDSAIRFSAPVHFGFDQSDVRPADRPILDRFAEVVRGYYSDATITVEGFTDSAGNAAYNQRLGEARANSVMEYLGGAGIPSNRMRAVSYGASRERQIVPGASGPGDGGWQNRRVAMVIDFGSAVGTTVPMPSNNPSES